MEIEVTNRAKVISREYRGNQSLDEVVSGQVGSPGQVVQIVGLEVSFISSTVRDKKQQNNPNKENCHSPAWH
jgi:hypothetical protein